MEVLGPRAHEDPSWTVVHKGAKKQPYQARALPGESDSSKAYVLKEVSTAQGGTQKQWICNLCNAKCTGLADLENHQSGRRHREVVASLWPCRICGMNCTSANCLSMHRIGNQHIEAVRAHNQVQHDGEYQKHFQDKEAWRCDVCDTFCTGHINLKAHLYGVKHKAKVAELAKDKLGDRRASETGEHEDPEQISVTQPAPAKATAAYFCKVCCVDCHSADELVAHCYTEAHQQKMVADGQKAEMLFRTTSAGASSSSVTPPPGLAPHALVMEEPPMMTTMTKHAPSVEVPAMTTIPSPSKPMSGVQFFEQLKPNTSQIGFAAGQSPARLWSDPSLAVEASPAEASDDDDFLDLLQNLLGPDGGDTQQIKNPQHPLCAERCAAQGLPMRSGQWAQNNAGIGVVGFDTEATSPGRVSWQNRAGHPGAQIPLRFGNGGGMAAGRQRADMGPSALQQLMCCPITHEVMRDPVLTEDGFTYERAAIVQWLQEHKTSPMTGEVLADTRLRPNILVKNAVEMSGMLQPRPS